MGELSKRIKHRWMLESTRGLEAIANLILLRYTDEDRYHRLFRDKLLSSHRNAYISTSVCSLESVRGVLTHVVTRPINYKSKIDCFLHKQADKNY
jgi:hypothetical protein